MGHGRTRDVEPQSPPRISEPRDDFCAHLNARTASRDTRGVDDKRLLTTVETAELLRISTRHLHRLVQAGTLRPIRLTPRGEFKFRASDLDALIERGVAA